MKQQTKKPRVYRRITPKTVSDFKVSQLTEGNNTAAVRVMEPDRASHKDRAYEIAKKSDNETTEQFIDNQLQQIGVDAINRIGQLVKSPNEQIASKNSQYVVDHIRGQATKKSINVTAKLNIQNVLD